MRYLPFRSTAATLRARPQILAGLLFGAVLPLLAAALVLAPLSGGLSDRISAPPPAYVIPTD